MPEGLGHRLNPASHTMPEGLGHRLNPASQAMPEALSHRLNPANEIIRGESRKYVKIAETQP